jgi:endonuclease YncB( thermonuclease family)
MVKSGYAIAYTAYSQDYVSEEQHAKEEKTGIWQYRFEKPWVWR